MDRSTWSSPSRHSRWLAALALCAAATCVVLVGCGDDAAIPANDTASDTAGDLAGDTTTDTSLPDTASDFTGDIPAGCGDGTIDTGEACDDGNDAASDGCDASCAVESGFTCTGQPSVCTATSTGVCGDGNVDAGEACDDGNGDSCDGCLADCTAHTSACGDTFVCGTEQCDDGNTAAGDGCSDTCANEGATSCGDGILQAGEGCDMGANNSDARPGDCSTACRTDCACPSCGDAVADFALGERCDDGNLAGGDGCSATCQLEVGAACGNGVLEAANLESCDDGNTAAGDGCSPTCQFEPVGASCGNGATDSDEVCDDGLQICANNTTACTQDSDCPAAGAQPQRCLPANGDTCNATCSFQNLADTFFETGPGGATLSTDNTYLWMANEFSGEVSRLDIAACIAHHAGLPAGQRCQDASGNLGCPNPCTAELVANVASPTGQANLSASSVVSDGIKAWWGAHGGPACAAATEAYFYELDLAACDAAIAGGGDCTSLATVVAGSGMGHVDGTGAAAQVGGLRGLTYYNGYVYFLDGGCGTLRRFDPTTAAVTTIIGDPSCPANPTFQEGPGGLLPSAGGASLLSPRYMDSDNSGFLYVSDNADHSISRYNVTTNYLERFAGDPTQGPGYSDNWDPTKARFDRPRDVTSDGTSLFVADFDNYTIRQVDLTSGRTTTMVGVPSPNANPDQKCDLFFGQGAAAGTGPRFHKPLEVAYHQPTGSLFFYTGGGAGANCFGAPACTPAEVRNQVWRVR